jgi:uncharacterized membrane protein YhaH (DUF805 family)
MTKQLRKEEYARRSRTMASFFKSPRVIFLRWSVVGSSAASAQLMLNYDRSHPLRRDVLSSCDEKCDRLPGEWIGQLLAFTSSPTPQIFVVATLTYGMVTLASYRLHDDDKYQAWFLMCGILVAAAIGFLDAMDLQGIILSSMPWCITMSLIMSACAHCILRRYKKREAAFDEEMQDEKDCASKWCMFGPR